MTQRNPRLAMLTLSVAAVGRNLFVGDHVEFVLEIADLAPAQIKTETFVELRWSF